MADPATPPERPRPRVLIAEDDTEMRALLATAMRRDGYEVMEARDGVQLLLHLEELCLKGTHAAAPDLIVSDIRMPGHTGLELLAAMHEADIVLPVILITAFSDAATQAQAARLHAILMDKPLDLDDLRKLIRQILF